MGYTVSLTDGQHLCPAMRGLPYKKAKAQAIRLLREFSPHDIMVIMPDGVMKRGIWAAYVAPTDDFDDYLKRCC